MYLKIMNMKKIVILIVAVLFFGINCFAQNEGKFRSMKDNIAKSDAAIQDAKKSAAIKTWLDRGKLFQDAYNVNVGFLRQGMSATEAKLFFKNPRQVLTSDGGLETYEYSQLKLNFENGSLRTWEETQTVVDDALGKAVNAYKQATSLDDKGKNTKKINESYRVITNDLESKFFNEYYLAKYTDAYQTALQRIDVNKLIGVTDTLYYFLAGYAAMDQSKIDSSMWQLAINNFETAISHGYRGSGDTKGQVYSLLFNSYMKINESEKALKVVQTGFEKYPNYEQLMYDLINYYLSREENVQALAYLDQAVAKDPQNPVLLFAKGRVLDQLGEKEKSLTAYDAAIAADPKYFDAYFNKAVVYYNEAIKLMEEANNERTNAAFEAKKKIADEEFMKAVPLLEKALEVRPNDVNTMETLRILYYRLRTVYPELETKYNDMVKKLEAAQ